MSNRKLRQAWETREGRACSTPAATDDAEARKLWRQFIAEDAAALLFGEVCSPAWWLLQAADWRDCIAHRETSQPWDREEFFKAINAARSMGPVPLP